MPAKKQPTGTTADLNLVTLLPLFSDEDKAREFLESKRWPDGIPYCPHCGAEGYALTQRSGRNLGLKKCKCCRKKFTVRVGTIYEESKLPLAKWLMAIHLMTSSKKGISAHQMSRELGVTVKTAWFLCHRIRECMKQENPEQLKGAVEVDEAWVGGRPRLSNNPGGASLPRQNVRNSVSGRPNARTNKQPVMVLVERNGNSIAFPIPAADGPTLKGAVRSLVQSGATLFSDESACYKGLGSEFAGGHHAVNHSAREYVRYEEHGGETYVSSNTIEGAEGKRLMYR